jgi:YspA, cpYpsA-related SLOG family
MRWLIAGSRSWDAKRAMFATLDHMVESHGKPDEVIHGGAKGADTFAGEWAKARNIPVTVYLADWSQYGKAAGIIRNNKMLDTNPDVVILFMSFMSSSTGTSPLWPDGGTAYTSGSKPDAERHEGSNPSQATNKENI